MQTKQHILGADLTFICKYKIIYQKPLLEAHGFHHQLGPRPLQSYLLKRISFFHSFHSLSQTKAMIAGELLLLLCTDVVRLVVVVKSNKYAMLCLAMTSNKLSLLCVCVTGV